MTDNEELIEFCITFSQQLALKVLMQPYIVSAMKIEVNKNIPLEMHLHLKHIDGFIEYDFDCIISRFVDDDGYREISFIHANDKTKDFKTRYIPTESEVEAIFNELIIWLNLLCV